MPRPGTAIEDGVRGNGRAADASMEILISVARQQWLRGASITFVDGGGCGVDRGGPMLEDLATTSGRCLAGGGGKTVVSVGVARRTTQLAAAS